MEAQEVDRVILSAPPHVEVDWTGAGWYTLHQQTDTQGQFLRWVKSVDEDGGEIFAKSVDDLR